MATFDLWELDLRSPSGKTLLAAVAAEQGNAIARAAGFTERLFMMRSGWAPGLCFVGGQALPEQADKRFSDLPPFSLAGAADVPEMAIVACIGEAVERLSQLERPADISCTAPSSEVHDRLLPGLLSLLSELREEADSEDDTILDWVEGKRLANSEPVLLPADWCLRRGKNASKLKARGPLSTGAAAGRTLEAATERALLELVERDAVSLWWTGGRRARPLSMELPAVRDGMELTRILRQGNRDRTSWLLDLTTDLSIPVIAAVSFDESGRGFTCGFAARVRLGDAIRAAVLELMMMELGLLLAIAKQDSLGEDALADVDRAHLRRSVMIDKETCGIVHPAGQASENIEDLQGRPLDVLTAAFCRSGIEAGIVNLTRDQFGIPAVFALAPALQPMPSTTTTARLRSSLNTRDYQAFAMPGVALI